MRMPAALERRERRRRMKPRQRQRGFTLVELVATIAVGSVALLGTLSAVLMGANVSRTAAETRAAARTSASMMEQIRSVPFVDLETTFDGTTHDFSALLPSGTEGQVDVAVTDVEGGNARWPVKRVELTASWQGADGRRVLSFATFVSDRLSTSSHSGTGYTESAAVSSGTSSAAIESDAATTTGEGE